MEGTVCAKAKKGEHKGHGVEGRHVWYNQSKEFIMESSRRRGLVEEGPVCSAKEFRTGQEANKDFKGAEGT